MAPTNQVPPGFGYNPWSSTGHKKQRQPDNAEFDINGKLIFLKKKKIVSLVFLSSISVLKIVPSKGSLSLYQIWLKIWFELQKEKNC